MNMAQVSKLSSLSYYHPIRYAIARKNFINEVIKNLPHEKIAKNHLPSMAFDYYTSGAWDEITLHDNQAAFQKIKLRPKMLVDVGDR